jgi:PAS domain S-box-containing protein
MPNRPFSDKSVQEDKILNAMAEVFRLQESILNATDLAILSTNSEGLITSFNHSAENLLGYSSEEAVGKLTPLVFHNLEEVVKQAERISSELGTNVEPVFEVFVAKAITQKTADRNEWTMVRKDGTHFPAVVLIITLRDGSGNVTGFAEIITDISESLKVREALEASEEKFRLLAENIPGAIYLCRNDAEYSPIYLDSKIESISGYSADEFLSGKVTLVGLFHTDDKKTILNTIQKSIEQRKHFQLRYRIRHASGEWKWINEAGAGVFVNDKLTMIEGFLSDATIQKQAEENLLQVAEENLRFFNNPVNLNALADFEGNLKRISPSWTQLLGWTEPELKSKAFLNFIHPDDVQSTREMFRSITRGSKAVTFENRIASKQGAFHWLLWGAASDPKDRIIYASAIDITERKKSEENILDSKTSLEMIAHKLQEQNQKLDEFAHIISHNLRAPVNNIQALIKLLTDKSEITDYKLIFDKLKNVAKNLSETMNELMDTLKVNTQPNIDRTEIRFKEILDKVVQSLEGELIVAQASVTFDFQVPAIQYSKPYL